MSSPGERCSPRRNREVAQELFDRWAQGFNDRDPAALAMLADPALILRPLTTLRLPDNPYRGHAGLREWCTETSYRFNGVTIAGRVLEATQDRFFVAGSIRVTTRPGLMPEQRAYWVISVRNGLVLTDQTFTDVIEARATFRAQVGGTPTPPK